MSFPHWFKKIKNVFLVAVRQLKILILLLINSKVVLNQQELDGTLHLY